MTTLWACAAADVPERRAALHPANPDAPESKPLPISTVLAPDTGLVDEAEQAEAHERHQQGAVKGSGDGSPDTAASDYTCPMHPEVSQAEPGRCPKCGMALEPRKQKGESKSSGEANPPHHEDHGEHGATR